MEKKEVIAQLLKNGSKMVKDLQVKNVTVAPQENYVRLGLTLNTPVEGMITKDNGVLYSSANMPAQLFYDGKRIGRFAAAERDAPELRDAVGDLRIQTGSADGGRKTETGLHQVNGDRPACKLGVQIQKFLFCAKRTQEIIAAAIGQAAHSRIFKPIDAGEGFIEGAIAACCIDAELLPCLPGLSGCGIGKLPGVACVGSDPNGIFSLGKTGPRRSRIDLPRQSTGTVCLAGSGVQKK